MSEGEAGAVKDTAKQLDETREICLKMAVLGSDRIIPASNVQATEEQRAFVNIGALPPPYDPYTLCTLLEHSNALRQCVDAMVANVDAFGHRFEPVIDLEGSDAKDTVRGILEEEHRASGNTQPVTDEEVAQRIEEIRVEMRRERTRLDAFFDFCCLDSSFTTLRRRTRQDEEVIGNGYWEVLRGPAGDIVQFVYIPGFTMRLMPLDLETTTVMEKVRESNLRYSEVRVEKRLRRYVQIFEARTVWFKEFGDPRTISRKTGRVFPSVEALKAVDPQDGPATEVLHFRIHSPKSPYGVPRWIGNLLAVLGSRFAEEVNYLYFENKSVPPLAVLVSGGRVSEDTVKRLQDFVNTEIKGKRNFHKMLILDAEAAGGAEMMNSGRMKIQIVPLTGSQHNDALFQNYDERNMDKVGMSFRLPRLLRGDVRDFNRATGEAALSFAEAQVFSPEREEFDFTMNRLVLADLGIRYWKFRSNAPTLRDPISLAGAVRDLVNANVLTPEEGRDLSEGVFNRNFRRIEDPWVRQPVQLTLAGVLPAEAEPTSTAAPAGAQGEPGTVGATTPPAPVAAPAGGSPAAPGGGAGMGLLTGTDFATVVTVNEARRQVGLGPLMLPDGGEDPDGNLPVADFREKRKALRAAQQAAAGEVGVPTMEQKACGTLQPAQENHLHRLPPPDLRKQALDLLALRDALLEAERAAAVAEHKAGAGR